jgi:hypothetical protein
VNTRKGGFFSAALVALALVTSLAAPAMAQSAVAAPSAVLTWTAPTTFTDGTPITGTITYNVYQGTAANALTKVATGVTTLTDTISTGLVDGATYYWSVTAVVNGVESAQTAPVSKTFSPGTPDGVVSLTVK